MEEHEVSRFLGGFAPDDVRATISWLDDHGYSLRAQSGEGTFGAQFVYAEHSEVRITVDRSQWLLDVAPRPGANSWQYDLLIAAHAGRPYGEVFPDAGGRLSGDPLADQLPEGVSWCDTLPDILEWVQGEGVEAAVADAHRERGQLMWRRSQK